MALGGFMIAQSPHLPLQMYSKIARAIAIAAVALVLWGIEEGKCM